MWILTILPEAIIHLIFWAGAIATCLGFVLHLIPGLSLYKLPVQICGVIILTLGTYLEGALANDNLWKLKALELQEKNARIETEIAKKDTEIIEKKVIETKIIKQRGEDIIKYVDREVVIYDPKFSNGGQCELPPEFFNAYNKSLELPTK